MSKGDNGNSNADLRLIEDYLPIEAISKEASREKSVRKGHISTLHLWWARRPLVACRAAVYGALVPADRWVKDVDLKNLPADLGKAVAVKNGKKKGLNRKAAKEFVTKLCRYPKADPTKPQEIKEKRETEQAIADAQRHILEAHAQRLTAELANAKKGDKPPAWVDEFKFTGNRVTHDDIIAGRAPRPRVLDMFAGGGAIPLEALRLGCEAYSLDLNPVAHVIQLCTLVYPQKYGRADRSVRGMTGPKNAKGEATWGGLADEVRYWGKRVLERVRSEIGDLYPLIPDPAFKNPAGKQLKHTANERASGTQGKFYAAPDDADDEDIAVSACPPGYLLPLAYLWTRTVRCKNPRCGASVPLVKQTWLCRKESRNVAMKMVAPSNSRHVGFEIAEVVDEKDLDFDPEGFSSAGNATCPFCGTVADSEYVKTEGCAGRLDEELMCVACARPGRKGKVYLPASFVEPRIMDKQALQERLDAMQKCYSISIPSEPIITDAKNSCWTHLYGLNKFGQLFNVRQLISLIAFSGSVRALAKQELHAYDDDRREALATILGICVSKLSDFSSSLCTFNYTGGRGVKNTFGRQALPMVWDYCETNPFNPAGASWPAVVADIPIVVDNLEEIGIPANVMRGSATTSPLADGMLDAVVTDPPYYDNVPYSNIADFFYVWLKRTLGEQFPEHFSGEGTPKKNEAVADATRHSNDRNRAKKAYEDMMARAFREAHRSLKADGYMAVVYAHKTTLGWSTLVDALRVAGFLVTEAWPLDTEKPGRLRDQESAALASSIFLIARRRRSDIGVGNYEDNVRPELQQIVRERVETLWEMGIAGADLVIACVGAGLRAFTKYERVEYANGEEVPAEKFLAEVEGAVLDTMMGKLFGQSGTSVSAIDPASRFYCLWRYVYKAAEIDAGEAIVFTYSQHVELDGPAGLSDGKDALVEKKKAKYRTRDFTERGKHEKLGMPAESGQPAPLIDVLHRALWLMENSPRKLGDFLDEARPDRERLRVLAQALAGAALSGKSEEEAVKLVSTTPAEQAALGKLLANWRSLIESRLAAQDDSLFRKR